MIARLIRWSIVNRFLVLLATLMLSACKKRGLAGVIVDAAIRDKLEILELDFPVFSAGFNPAGPTK